MIKSDGNGGFIVKKTIAFWSAVVILVVAPCSLSVNIFNFFTYKSFVNRYERMETKIDNFIEKAAARIGENEKRIAENIIKIENNKEKIVK